MRPWIKILIGVVIGFGAGFGSGFFFHKKLNDVKFEEITEEEMAAIEEMEANKVNTNTNVDEEVVQKVADIVEKTEDFSQAEAYIVEETDDFSLAEADTVQETEDASQAEEKIVQDTENTLLTEEDKVQETEDNLQVEENTVPEADQVQEEVIPQEPAAMQPEARVKICQNCGETVDADDVFCIYCGTRLASAIVNSAASEQTGPVPAVGAFSVPGETEVKASDYIPAWNTEQETPVEAAAPAWNAAVEAPAEDTAPAWNAVQEAAAEDYAPAWNTEQEAPVEDAAPAWNAAVEAPVEDAAPAWNAAVETPAEDTAPAWNTEQEAAAENFAPAWNTEQEAPVEDAAPAWNTEQEAPVQEAALTWGAENEEKTAEAEAQSLSAAWSTPDDSSMQNLDLLMEEDATVRLDNAKNTLEGFDESSTMVNEPGGSYAAEMSSAPYAGGTGEGAYTSEEPAAPYTAEMPAEQYEAGIPAASYAAEMPAEQYSPEPVPGEAADENAESVEEAPSEKIEEIICPHCGAKVPSVYSFCIFCGSQLAGAVSDHSEEDDDRTAGSHVGRESMEASNYDAGEPEEDQLKEDMRDNGMENYKDAGSGFFFGGSL